MAYKYENQTKIKINIIKLNLNRTFYIKAYGITKKIYSYIHLGLYYQNN